MIGWDKNLMNFSKNIYDKSAIWFNLNLSSLSSQQKS